MIEIKEGVFISAEELVFKRSRSSGPGGQNVNKVNTRVTVFFDVSNCQSLSEAQKKRILKKLASRADKNGMIRVASQRHRRQKANQNATVERLRELLKQALTKKPVRKKTKVPFSAIQRRLEEKKKRSLLKKERSKKGIGYE